MRSKPVQWLMVAALLSTIAVPGWAQPELVGGEFKVNQNNSRQLSPQVAFSPSGTSLIVWENSRFGILGRAFDRNGNPTTPELVLAGNDLPGIPSSGKVMIRKEPALAYLPSGEFLVLWTEEKDFLVLDHFYERREILEQDVYGQRFSAQGAPLGQRFRVNATTAHFQRRPKVAVRAGGVVVVWEQALNTHREGDSTAVYGRLLTRRGAPASGELRIDASQSPEIWNVAVAANASGKFLVAWEGGDVLSPNILARLYERDGTPLGAPFVANPATLGRQRRPAVLATRDGDFLVAWQSYVKDTPIHGIQCQFYSSAGARIGSEFQISKGVGQVQISPALALLPSGNIVVAWMDWIGTLPIGAYAVVIDDIGVPLGDEVLISQERLYPQYRISVSANAHGDILAAWESRITRERAIAGRHLRAD